MSQLNQTISRSVNSGGKDQPSLYFSRLTKFSFFESVILRGQLFFTQPTKRLSPKVHVLSLSRCSLSLPSPACIIYNHTRWLNMFSFQRCPWPLCQAQGDQLLLRVVPVLSSQGLHRALQLLDTALFLQSFSSGWARRWASLQNSQSSRGPRLTSIWFVLSVPTRGIRPYKNEPAGPRRACTLLGFCVNKKKQVLVL